MPILRFESAGQVATNPLTPDSDPNAATPAAARIINLPDRTETGKFSEDARVYVEFSNITAGNPAVDIIPWVEDTARGVWVKATALSGLEDKDFVTVPGLAPGKTFWQVVGFSGGSADQVEIFVAPK